MIKFYHISIHWLSLCLGVSQFSCNRTSYHVKDSGHQIILNKFGQRDKSKLTKNPHKDNKVNPPSSHSKLPTLPRSPRCKAVVVAARNPDQLERSGTGSCNNNSKASTCVANQGGLKGVTRGEISNVSYILYIIFIAYLYHIYIIFVVFLMNSCNKEFIGLCLELKMFPSLF